MPTAIGWHLWLLRKSRKNVPENSVDYMETVTDRYRRWWQAFGVLMEKRLRVLSSSRSLLGEEGFSGLAFNPISYIFLHNISLKVP